MFYSPEARVYHPVDEDRISKQFCRKFYFGLGRSSAKGSYSNIKSRRILGVPIHYFRDFASTFIRYIGHLILFDSTGSLYYQLHSILAMGKIYQSFSMRRQVESRESR
jgi:hypothetical protein